MHRPYNKISQTPDARIYSVKQPRGKSFESRTQQEGSVMQLFRARFLVKSVKYVESFSVSGLVLQS